MASNNVKFSHFIIVFAISVSLSSAEQKAVVALNETNWTDMLETEWMVEFYAPWCPACKALEETWNELAARSASLGMKVGKVDVITSPGLSGRFMVTALPTIFHVLNGEFRQYRGSRDRESLISFIQEKKWTQIDPVPGWKSPNSFQMTVVSSFFELSQNLRDLHNQMTEDFGLPTWGSYLIFAIATIVVGAVLGLALVCLIDLVFPPRRVDVKPNTTARKEKKKDSDDELADEDIKDDLVDDADQSDIQNEMTGSDSDQNNDVNAPSKFKKRRPRRAD